MYNILYTLISNILFQSLPIFNFPHFPHDTFWDFMGFFESFPLMTASFPRHFVENSPLIRRVFHSFCGKQCSYLWIFVRRQFTSRMVYRSFRVQNAIFCIILAIKSVIVSGLNVKNCKPVMALFCTFRLAFDVFCGFAFSSVTTTAKLQFPTYIISKRFAHFYFFLFKFHII